MKNCVENLLRSKEWLAKEQELKSFLLHCNKHLESNELPEEKKQGVRRNKADTEAKLAYMEEIVNIVNEIMIGYGVKSKVRLDIAKDFTKAELGLNCYNLDIKLFECGPISNPQNRMNLVTNICHEMGHIINEDVKFFTAARGFTEINRGFNKKLDSSMNYKVSIVLNVLSECRADFFGRRNAVNLYNNYAFDWVKGDNHYSKTGYLPAVDRRAVLERFGEYNYDFVNFMFDNCFERDGFVSRDMVNTYLSTAKATLIPKSWAYQLLLGESK